MGRHNLEVRFLMYEIKKNESKIVRVWMEGDEEPTEYQALEHPIVNENWISIKCLKSEVHINITLCGKFEVL